MGRPEGLRGEAPGCGECPALLHGPALTAGKERQEETCVKETTILLCKNQADIPLPHDRSAASHATGTCPDVPNRWEP